MSKTTAGNIPYCKNCHYPLAEFDKFCPHCGQKKTDGKVTMHDLLHEMVHMLWHVDGKFFWTLKHLFIPGKLTVEFFKGHHKRYAHPIQLFLVLGVLAFGMVQGATKSKKENSEIKSEESVFRKQLLLELDSIKTTLPQYNDPSVAMAIDTLLVRGYGRDEKKDKIEEAKQKLKEQKVFIDSINKNIVKLSTEAIALKAVNDTSKLEEIEEKIASLKAEIKDTQNVKITYQQEDMEEGIIKFDVSDGVKFQPQHFLRKDKNKMLFYRDSTEIGLFDKNYRLAKVDLYHYSEEELIENLGIEGYFNKIFYKQIIKLKKQGQEELKEYLFHKLVWIVAATILPMALFYLLLYRRQKRYYVEHVVFLLHFSTMLFGFTILLLLLRKLNSSNFSNFATGISYMYLMLIAMPVAMKNYYAQGWIKTIVKFFCASFVFMLVSSVIMTIGLAISFAMF